MSISDAQSFNDDAAPVLPPGDPTLKEVCEWDRSSEWKVRKLIKDKEYKSYIDGRTRKITRESYVARRNRLINEQKPSPTTPPPPDRAKLAKARAEARVRRHKRKAARLPAA
jgi:hypothetical protein